MLGRVSIHETIIESQPSQLSKSREDLAVEKESVRESLPTQGVETERNVETGRNMITEEATKKKGSTKAQSIIDSSANCQWK